MFRNVYWHHAVRAATVMYKRIVDDALESGLLAGDELVGQTDEGLLFLLEERARSARAARATAGPPPISSSGAAPGGAMAEAAGAEGVEPGDVGEVAEVAARVERWIARLRTRRLPKRAGEVVAAELEGKVAGEWLAVDSPLKRRVEERLAQELGLEPGGVYLDYPEKPAMFALDLLLQRKSGAVLRLGPTGEAGLIGLPRMAALLYQSARVLRIFTVGGRRRVDAGSLIRLAALTPAEVADRLDASAPLLA
jgi:hypothetical protein